MRLLGWLRRGQSRSGGGPAGSRIPRFERLEARILLSVDIGLSSPIVDPDHLRFDDQAIEVNLRPGQAYVQDCREEVILDERGAVQAQDSTPAVVPDPEGNPSSPTESESGGTGAEISTLKVAVAATEVSLAPASAGVVNVDSVDVVPVSQGEANPGQRAGEAIQIRGPPQAESGVSNTGDVQLEYVDAGGQTDLVIRLDTQDSTTIEVFDNNRGVLLASHALGEINSLTVIGGDNSNDTLTVDLSNPFSIPGGIVFAGGDGGYDRLVLTGNSELTAEYVGQGDDDGTIIVFGEEGDPIHVSYSGLEPFVYLKEFGAVKNLGVFDYGNSPEILNAETFSQASDATLVIEIGGLTPGQGTPIDNGYDQIRVTGTATLGGTLQILLINDFNPRLGENFEIMTFGSVVGDFATFSGYDLGEGLYLAPVKTAQMYRLDVVDYDPFAAGDVPKNLNVVIDDLLDDFDKENPPTGEVVFTSSDGEIPNGITIGGADLELRDATLTFSGLVYDFATKRWTGQVAVEAAEATLYQGLLNIEVTDDDADVLAVAGIIDLAVGSSGSYLQLDDLEAEDIGWPSFIEIEITDLKLRFADFRKNDMENTLDLSATFVGLDTGNQALNDLLSADNPLFGLKVTGSVQDLELSMDAIRQGVRNLISGKIDFPSSPIVNLSGITGQIAGKLFKVGSLEAGFIVNDVTVDPDGSGPLPERSAVYVAIEGSYALGNETWGGRSCTLAAPWHSPNSGPSSCTSPAARSRGSSLPQGSRSKRSTSGCVSTRPLRISSSRPTSRPPGRQWLTITFPIPTIPSTRTCTSSR